MKNDKGQAGQAAADEDRDLRGLDLRRALAQGLGAVIGRVLQKNEEYLKGLQALEKKSPPSVSEELMHKLKREYPGQEEKAFATAWKIHKKGNGDKTEKSEGDPRTRQGTCPMCDQKVTLTSAGMISGHSKGGKECSGRGCDPKVEKAEGAPAMPKPPAPPKPPTAAPTAKAEPVAKGPPPVPVAAVKHPSMSPEGLPLVGARIPRPAPTPVASPHSPGVTPPKLPGMTPPRVSKASTMQAPGQAPQTFVSDAPPPVAKPAGTPLSGFKSLADPAAMAAHIGKFKTLAAAVGKTEKTEGMCKSCGKPMHKNDQCA